MDYQEFIERKTQINNNSGFKPNFIPDYLFDFQKAILDWSINKGKSAIFADCGLGKSIMELVWAENIVRKTNGNVLLLTPLAVGQQMEKEANKFGISAHRSRDGQIKGKITITNYEQLHHFNSSDFQGVICDESSILKNFKGHIKQEINIFMRKVQYRLLATATAAPNDFIELGTSSEALGYLGFTDMLNKFFKNDLNNSSTGNHYGERVQWRLKKHAHESFFKWVTSWARAIRMPSDIGFKNDGYLLPAIIENDFLIESKGRFIEGVLPGFETEAHGLKEERDETRATIKDRCEKVAEIINKTSDFAVIWCNLNEEGNLLEKLIKDSIQVSGKDDDEKKESKLSEFAEGNERVMIIKPKIGGFGLNWQHCNHVTIFPTHSYEQYYQAIRRCWRFGQKRPVTVDIIYTKGYENVLKNLKRKQKQADEMFTKLVRFMNDSMNIDKNKYFNKNMEVPLWL